MELAAGILALVYRNKVYNTSESEYSDGWEKAIEEYDGDNEATNTVDTLQKRVSVCSYNLSTIVVTLGPPKVAAIER